MSFGNLLANLQVPFLLPSLLSDLVSLLGEIKYGKISKSLKIL